MLMLKKDGLDTVKSMKADKLKGFRLGADDYITKPIDEEELVARVHAILRRSAAESAGNTGRGI